MERRRVGGVTEHVAAHFRLAHELDWQAGSAPAEAVEFAVGMAEIHAGTAAGIDRTVFPLNTSAVAAARLEPSPAPCVVVELA